MQPRYLLPLIVVFAGLAVLAVRNTRVRFTRPQLVVLVATLSVTQFIALYVNMVRYIQGVGAAGWNLDSGIKWWWDIPFSPMFVSSSDERGQPNVSGAARSLDAKIAASGICRRRSEQDP